MQVSASVPDMSGCSDCVNHQVWSRYCLKVQIVSITRSGPGIVWMFRLCQSPGLVQVLSEGSDCVNHQVWSSYCLKVQIVSITRSGPGIV